MPSDQYMPSDRLGLTFTALADPTRRAIVARLYESGEATVNELAEPFPMSLQAVSKHLKVLERAGLISRGRTAQLRPSSLRGEPLREIDEWLARYRGIWEVVRIGCKSASRKYKEGECRWLISTRWPSGRS
jgi:DNA-binding transcriptional ArsR family regulator